MLGLAIIVASVLLYKAYKLRLKHNMEIENLRRENANLRAQLESLRNEYAQILKQTQEKVGSSGGDMTDTQKVAQIAEAIRRKELF